MAAAILAGCVAVGAIAGAGEGDGDPVTVEDGTPTAETSPAPDGGPPSTGSESADLTEEENARVAEVLALAEGFAEPFARGTATIQTRGPWTTAAGIPIGAFAIVLFTEPVDLPETYEGVVPIGEGGTPVVGESVDERGLPLTQPYRSGELDDIHAITVNIDLATGQIHNLSPIA